MSKKKETNDNLDFRSGTESSESKFNKNTAKRIAVNLAIGIIALGIPLFFVGRCSKANTKDDNKANTESVRADSTMQSLWAQNHKMHDALLVANDSIDVLNTKNDSLQFACDSLASELDDCQSSKVAVVKPAPVKKETKKSPTVAKPSTVKPVAPVKPSNKPQEPVVPQGPKEIESGSTTVNINTPSNIININNGGVINNYIEEQKKAEEQYIKEYKCAQEAYKDGFVPTGRRVRCK